MGMRGRQWPLSTQIRLSAREVDRFTVLRAIASLVVCINKRSDGGVEVAVADWLLDARDVRES
jgi:hypothetical protein